MPRGVLQPGDVIVAADGKPVRNREELRAILERKSVGDAVRLSFKRAGKRHNVAIKTTSDVTEPKRPIIGVLPIQAFNVHFPFNIRFDLGAGRGPVGRPGVRARAARAARPRRRPRLQGRRDRRDPARRHSDEDRRHQAEDARSASGGHRRLPGPQGWGQRAGGEAARGRRSHHPCGELSTGVARAGNTAAEGLTSAQISGLSKLQENA